MKIIDFSHTINNQITVFKDAEKPNIQPASTHENDGYAQKKIVIYSHNSTHVDAPFHIIPDGPTLDKLPLDTFFGPGLVADCTHCKETIGIDDLKKYADRLDDADFILLNTGWYKKWNTPGYKSGFPVLSEEAAEWLLRFRLKGIGLDTISIDTIDSKDLPVHNIILAQHMVIIENLTNLGEMSTHEFIFSCLPLKFEEADGSPVRAVGILGE